MQSTALARPLLEASGYMGIGQFGVRKETPEYMSPTHRVNHPSLGPSQKESGVLWLALVS